MEAHVLENPERVGAKSRHAIGREVDRGGYVDGEGKFESEEVPGAGGVQEKSWSEDLGLRIKQTTN